MSKQFSVECWKYNFVIILNYWNQFNQPSCISRNLMTAYAFASHDWFVGLAVIPLVFICFATPNFKLLQCKSCSKCYQVAVLKLIFSHLIRVCVFEQFETIATNWLTSEGNTTLLACLLGRDYFIKFKEMDLKKSSKVKEVIFSSYSGRLDKSFLAILIDFGYSFHSQPLWNTCFL